MCAIARIEGWVRDAVDVVTGRRPDLRNRIKFLLLSPIYDAFYVVVPVDPHGALARRLPADARRVLDLCMGTALVPAVVTARRPDVCVVGLDLSPEMLAMGRAKLAAAGGTNASLVRGDAGRLPFPDASFDAVTVSYGLHELPAEVRARAIREAARVLRPRGMFLAADLARPPRLGWLVDAYLRVGEPSHARDVLGDGLVELVRATGLVVVAHEPPSGAAPMQLLVARRADNGRRAPWKKGGEVSHDPVDPGARRRMCRCARGGGCRRRHVAARSPVLDGRFRAADLAGAQSRARCRQAHQQVRGHPRQV